MHVIAAKAVCFHEAAQPEFAEYQKKVVSNSSAFAESLINRGFELVSGGTDNHLVLLNVLPKGLTGKEAEKLLDDCNITTNKNTIPNDPNGPFVTSGIRMGSAAMTTRGFGPDDFDKVAEAISLVFSHPGDKTVAQKVISMVKELCDEHPLY